MMQLQQTSTHTTIQTKKRTADPHLKCGICHRAIKADMVGGVLTMILHNPDSGESVSQEELACVGNSFPDQAVPLF